MTKSNSQITTHRLLSAWLFLGVVVPGFCALSAGDASEGETDRLVVQKAVTRPHAGKHVAFELRAVGPGDSLWRILIQERGLSEDRFSQYLHLVRTLNPQIKRLDRLKAGDILLVPLNADEVLGVEPAARQRSPESRQVHPAPTREYRVMPGDALYRILRRELQIVGERELATYVALVKDLNPQKKNWANLRADEILRLPVSRKAATKTIKDIKPSYPLHPQEGREKMAAASVTGRDAANDARGLEAREHAALLMKIIESLGNDVERSGEEVLSLKAGTIRLNKALYPVVYNRKLDQKIIFDPDNQFPASLRHRLEHPSIGIPVVALRQGESLQEGVGHLLSHLGYQLLTSERPVVLHVGSVSFEARGSWVVLAPEGYNTPQEVYVINLTGQSEERIPEYLKTELSLRGLHMRDVAGPEPSTLRPAPVNLLSNNSTHEVRRWSQENEELVDAVLAGYGLTYGVADTLSIELRDGLRLDIKSDRTLDTKGQRTAFFFHRLEPEVKTILQEQNGVRSIELELTTTSRREIIARLLHGIGDAVEYREHRFSVTDSAHRERLKVRATGFLLQRKGLFLTDREIPEFLQRLFFEKGLEIVYFH